mgnify:CR=1 FL=1
MIPSATAAMRAPKAVYQRGLVIDSQRSAAAVPEGVSISKGIGD